MITIFFNILWRLNQVLFKQGLSFLIFFMSSQVLLPIEFSTYTYVFSIIFILSIFGDFGLSSSVSRFSSELKNNEESKLNYLLISITSYIFLVVLGISVIFLLFGKFLFEPEIYKYLLISFPLIFLIPIFGVYDGVFRGIGEFKKLSIASIISGIIGIILFIILSKDYGITGIIFSQIIYYVLLILILIYVYPYKFKFKIDAPLNKRIISYGTKIGIAILGYSLFVKADIIMIKQFGYLSYVGNYEIVNKFIELLIIPFTAIGQVIAPKITEKKLSKKRQLEKKQALIISTSIFFIGIISSIAFYFLFPIIVSAYFGSYNTDSIARILSILIFILPLRLSSSFITQGFIVPNGIFNFVTYFIVLFGIVNIILNLVLFNMFGIDGVFVATLISMGCYIITKDLYFILIILGRNEKINKIH